MDRPLEHATAGHARGLAARLSFVGALFLFAAALVAVLAVVAPR
jgi:hypothetical protein